MNYPGQSQLRLENARRTRRRGFTLLETMLAAMVMAFALTTSITTMQRTFHMLSSAHHLTAGSQIIKNELEKIRMQPWATVSAYPRSANVTIDSAFTTDPKVGDRFTLTRGVTNVRGNRDLLEITLTISWRSFGRTLSRSFTIYYARYGTYDYVYNAT